MSLETELHKLTEAMLALASATTVSPATPAAPATPVPGVPATPVTSATLTPVATPALAAVPASPVMPAAPNLETLATPVAPVPGAVPFTDAKGLVDWVMTKYRDLGPVQGVLIQNVLVGMGYQNINEVKPEHYPQLHQEVEMIKAPA